MRVIYLNKQDRELIWRALGYAKKYRLKIALLFGCMVIGIGIMLYQPLIWGRLLVNLMEKEFAQVLVNILYFLLLYAGQALITFCQFYLSSFVNNNIIYDLKLDIYKKILNLPVKAFDELSVGDFISRLHGDASTIAEIILNHFLQVIFDILRVVIIGVTVFSISLPLGGIVVLVFPFTYLIFVKYGGILKEKNRELKVANDKYFSGLQQTISGIREVKSLGAKEKNVQLFASLARDLRLKNIKITVIGTLSQTLSSSINILAEIAIIAMGGYLIYRDLLLVEYFIAFRTYSIQFSSSLTNITKLNSNIQQSLASLERIFQLMDNFTYDHERFGEEEPQRIEGSVLFSDVDFHYNPEKPILQGISFTIKPKSKVGIVGRSGSGKTTIFNLLIRFYQPAHGEILIDQIPVEELSEQALRQHISIVRQDPFLFNISIKDNLLLAKPTASDEELITACQAAYIHQEIMKLPEQYNSLVGENGQLFSGGQKQRLAIARAILKNSEIILFDEATSALDSLSQYYIHKAQNELAQKRTVIVITHQIKTVEDADQIILIDDGKIIGQGTHVELLKADLTYRRLINLC